jgi:glycosyltransferase involved in cell wall biosynthesis
VKVSIITPVYNNQIDIISNINSINSQSYRNIEHVIVDGCSTDGTVALIKENLNSNIKFISEKDQGIYDAMNKGIENSIGQVIGILNSDDFYFDKNTIQNVVEEFERDPDLDILFGDLEYVSKNDVNITVRIWRSKQFFSNYFELGNVPPHPTLFVRRHVYDKAGLFNLNFKLAADFEFMLRLFKNHNFKSKYFPETIVKMRLGGATNKSINNIIRGNFEIYKAWKLNNIKMPFYFFPLKLISRIKQFIQ